MASWRTLPAWFALPLHSVNASIPTGASVIALTCAYLLAASIQGAFTAIVDASGRFFAITREAGPGRPPPQRPATPGRDLLRHPT